MQKVAPDGANDLSKRLETLQKLNAAEWVNKDLYRILYKQDSYIVAYERIKSRPGNMTPGGDGKTLDGISLKDFDTLIEEMRTEKYQPSPVKTTSLPKANGKLRKLGIPSVRDKVVQEIIRAILESIYDSPLGPTFTETSHGFRSKKNCHSALQTIQTRWSGANWIIEGDISNCFDDISHEKLIELLRKRIDDERFLNLIRKFLNAGYFDVKGEKQNSIAGTPQGGIVSPILANIYLHELDKFVEDIKRELENGELKSPNPEYRALVRQKAKLAKQGQTKSDKFRGVLKEIKNLPSLNPRDENFVRIKYVRYADDWVIGVSGSKELANNIKTRVGEFLKNELNLSLSQEKTTITNAKNEDAKFLGFLIRIGKPTEQAKQTKSTNGSGETFKRRSTGWEVILKAPIDNIIEKLSMKNFCKEGKPIAKDAWSHLDEDQIIALYNGINRGYLNYYRPADNYASLNRIQYILKFSLAKTIASKRRKSIGEVFKGQDISYTYNTKNGSKTVTFFRNTDWTKDRNGFKTEAEIDKVLMVIRLRTRSNMGLPCVVCGSEENVEMHLLRHLRKADSKKAGMEIGFARVMQALNRKQVLVCQKCHTAIHKGKYDSMKLSDLAYDPRRVQAMLPPKEKRQADN